MPASELLPFALGDMDEEIVYRATIAFLSPWSATDSPSHERLTDAIEWVRRRLALNCAAVFAALMSLGDAAVLERLRPVRVALDDDERACVLRRLSGHPSAPIAEFLESWTALTRPR